MTLNWSFCCPRRVRGDDRTSGLNGSKSIILFYKKRKKEVDKPVDIISGDAKGELADRKRFGVRIRVDSRVSMPGVSKT